MKYNISELDKYLLVQSTIDYKYRLYITDNNNNILDMLEGVQNAGNYNIDSQSDIRRTSSFVLQLDEFYREKSLEQKIYSWIGYNFCLQIGVLNIRENDYEWYDCGYYTITALNTSYSSTSNSMSVTLSDHMAKLDGTRNGVIGGAQIIKIPTEDDDGNKTIIKTALISFLRLSADIKNYIVDDIGEFFALPDNNENWQTYRDENPNWNVLPYDLEYDGNATILDIIRSLCELYPNYQYYFDIYGNLCVSMIPSCENYPITLDNSFLQEILIADNTESVQYDISSIKNVTEVFGKSYEIDRMSQSCSLTNNVYTIILDEYESYKSNEYISFTPDKPNVANTKIRINSLDAIPLYIENTSNYIENDTLKSDEIYVLKIKKINQEYVAYYLGQFQPHALCVLSNDEDDSYYTKKYFAEKYNCDEKNIVLRIEKDSPFSVQKIGEVLDYKSGDEFDNIESDSVAQENALYYNKTSTTFNDVVTITTKMIPFLDVYQKITYKRADEQEENEYVIKSINNDLNNMTSTITMYRFYPLYYN